MKKNLFFIAVFVLIIGKIVAGPVDAQRAMQIGQSFFSAKALKSNIRLQLVHTSTTRDAVDYYAFNINGDNGFVIISGDDRVKPVLAYSTTGSFDPSNIADGFLFTLNSFRQEIQYVREHNIEASDDIVSEWKSIAETGYINKERTSREVVGPLCQTIWDQNFPYNSQCPEDAEGSGGYVYAGCVATAMGQVMKHWNYPEHGTGSYTYNPDGYPQQTANFGETEYHFELMPNDLDSLSTEEDCFHVAQLLHHCGIAINMQYSGHGSGAYSDDVPYALRSYFGYTCDDFEIQGFWGWNLYTNEEWAQMLKNGGLDEGMPLYYSGQDDSGAGGHAFVCDGYDENDYFHFNWGWNGRDDAWCPIGALNTTKYAFNGSNGFIGHIQPKEMAYYEERPENVTNLEIVENQDKSSVTLRWTNPSHKLNGEPLDDFDINIYRNGRLIADAFYGQMPGQAGEFTDFNLEEGLYQYGVTIVNDYGFSHRVHKTILVGEKCDIVFELTDEGGDGWKGACISVTNETGQRIAKVTMEEGSTQTVVTPLLKGNLNFIWNHGWYHTNEQYDTDNECAFIIKNTDDEVLFTSGEHSDGVFMTYNNDCEGGDDTVEEINAENACLYPNPTNGIVNIEGNGAMTVSVMNTLGQKVFETTATDNTTINLNGFESGIYMVRIETENGIKTEKVNVKK